MYQKYLFIFLFILSFFLPACTFFLKEPEPVQEKVELEPATERNVFSLSEKARHAGFSAAGRNLRLTYNNIRLVIDTTEQSEFREAYQVRNRRGEWVETLVTPAHIRSTEGIVYTRDGELMLEKALSYDRVVPLVDASGFPVIKLYGGDRDFQWEKEITMDPHAQAFHAYVRFNINKSIELNTLNSRYCYLPESGETKPDFVWTPCLRPEPDDLIADQSFRSPAVILQKKKILASLVPDLFFLETGGPMRTALNVDCLNPDGPLLSFGFTHWRTRGHVYYRQDATKKTNLSTTFLDYGFYLLLDGNAPDYLGYSGVTRFLWKRFGKPLMEKNKNTPIRSLQDLEREAFDIEADRLFYSVAGAPPRGGLIKSGLARFTNDKTDIDAWFSARFQSIRTACGMYLYGMRTGKPDLVQRSRSMVNLLLAAPHDRGPFPSILCISENGRDFEWIPDSGWAGYHDHYHLFDCSWTGCWLLKFADLEPEYLKKVLDYLLPYADYLYASQNADGSFPSWVSSESLRPNEEVNRYFKAETSCSAHFLTLLYEHTDNKDYLDMAVRAMEFITRAILPRRKWQDFETFLSSSRKPFDYFDEYSHQPPQSTLNIFQAGWAYLKLFENTRNERYLALGKFTVDYALLYQQVWTPPFMNKNLFGGFGVQNTDAEWSDARGSYAADLLFDYYSATGIYEYFERAVASLHAVINVLPHTYWGDSGEDRPGGAASFHWGLGSVATSSEIYRTRFGDILIDLEQSRWCSLNRHRIDSLEIEGPNISFECSTIAGPNRVMVKFTGFSYGMYYLRINGEVPSSYNASELSSGIEINSMIR